MIRRLNWLLLIAIAAAGTAAAFLYSHSLVTYLFVSIAAFSLGVLVCSFRTGPTKAPSSSLKGVTARNQLTDNVRRLAFDEVSEALMVVDTQLRVVVANPAARQLFPNIREDELSRLTEITRETSLYGAFRAALEGREHNDLKVEFYRDSPRIFAVRVVPVCALGSDEVAAAVGIFLDVTKLGRLESVRQEFLSNVSHELRTPLTSIMALAETLAAGAVDDPANNRRFLAIIQKNSQRMHQLLNDILELSAIESGTVNVHSENIPLKQLVDDVIHSLSATTSARNISVINEVNSNVVVLADARRLIQMLTNLIENAVKFNRENGTVIVSHDRSDRRDRIHVADTGEGIPAQHLDRIFERFYRVDRARSRGLGGTGLGLAIVKHLARAHQGDITVASTVGSGSEFIIDLPTIE